MPNDKKNAAQASTAPAPASDFPAGFRPPQGLVNLNTRYPSYDGGDARIEKAGHKGYPIHGLLLGTVKLPSLQKDDEGNDRPWDVYVIELLQPCPVIDSEEDAKTRMAPVGTRIVVTKSKAMTREDFDLAATHPTNVFECLITPEVSKNKKGQNMWIYPRLEIGRPQPRLPTHQVRYPGLDEARKLAQLENGNAARVLPAHEDVEPPPYVGQARGSEA